MPLIDYKSTRLKTAAMGVITHANKILEEYAAQGLSLTLRQLYYQFVARGLIPNTQRDYARLGRIVDDGRLTGLVDWDAIIDRTRRSTGNQHWSSPDALVGVLSHSYHTDLWADQEYRPEVWIEKDALVGVIEDMCSGLDVPFTSCRGYTSQSEMWRSAQRMVEYDEAGQFPIVLHFGDHDPSGKDMSRDIEERLNMFMQHETGSSIQFKRLALNMNQVRKYSPPPNPAKSTDSRFHAYMTEFGKQSWELDALDPKVLRELVRTEVIKLMDVDKMNAARAKMLQGRELLKKTSDQWPKIVKMLNRKPRKRKK